MIALIRNIRVFILAVAIAIAAACDHNEPERIVGSVEFTAVYDAFTFEAGDQIAVMNAEKPFKASVKEGEVRFIGDVLQADDYYAVYPYSALKYFSPDEPAVAVMSLPTVQKAVKNGIPRELRLSIGHASDNDRRMVFNEKVSYLKFTIGPESGKVRSISMVSDSSPISGDFSVLCDGGYDTYPMPASAYNVCLAAPGECLEQGDYYIAFRYVNSLSLDIAFEDSEGRIALKSTSVSSYEPGQVVDMGTVGGLTYQYRDVIPSTGTLIYRQPASGVLDVELLSSGDVRLNVIEGGEWLSVLQTRAVSSSVFRLSYKENTGAPRTGRIEVCGEDGGRRLIYTIVQYGLSGTPDKTALLEGLSGFYESTGGPGWKNNTNWCSDQSLSQWYGLTVNEWGDLQSIHLSNNDLSGELPEAFEGLETVLSFSLYRNAALSGNIPSYIYNVRSVELTYGSFESISDVTDTENALISNLYLSNNNITGQLPENIPYIPHLTYLDLQNNHFSGTIPESYGKILARGGNIRLNGNELSGEIPESIRRDERFRRTLWVDFMFQEGQGFDFSNVEIYSNFDAGWDMDSNPVSIPDFIAEHEYTLYIDQYSDISLLPEVAGWFQQYGEHGFGVVCLIDQRSYADVQERYDLEWLFISNSHSSKAEMLLMESDGRIVLNPGSSDKDDVLAFLESRFGSFEGRVEPEPEPEPEQPVLEPLDGIVKTIQTAEDGNGIDIVLMGDSYGYDAVKDGTYESVMREVADYFFEIEPYNSYRHLFNVYMVNVVSDEGSKLGCAYGEGTSITGNDELCFQYAAKALSPERVDNALVITIVNSTQFGGSTYMYAPDSGDWGNGKAVSYIPKVQKKMDFRGLIQHEAGGHGFAKLADEYVGAQETLVPDYEKELKSANEKYGWYRNIDFTGDPLAVKWSHILADERYASEPEGVYEGALGYGTGVWRPTYTSIMKDNQGIFNAPSREAIWYRIHKLAYGPDWLYSFSSFAEYDAINRR